jgi:hypothetical protein
MSSYYNRYAQFIANNTAVTVPFVKIPEKLTDLFVVYKLNRSRLDKISQDKYETPYFGFLIMAANPEYGGLEWNIPDNASVRVPYPLDQSISDYKAALKVKLSYYGE